MKYKTFVEERWNKGIDNYLDSIVPNTVKKPCKTKAIEDVGAVLLMGHAKALELLSDPEKAKMLAPYKTIDPFTFALHQGLMRIPKPD